MTAVPVKATTGLKSSFETDEPVPLFEANIVGGARTEDFHYDVAPDGKRFLVDTNTAAASAPPLTVVVNWTTGLKK